MTHVAVVLGKYLNDDGSLSTDAMARCAKGIELYQSGKVDTLILSGGRANGKAPFTEAEVMKLYFVENGVSENAIITERRSKNTFENARECAFILKDVLCEEMYLISSAKHLYRPYFNPYRFFRWNFGLRVKVCAAMDCNVTLPVGFAKDRSSQLVFYRRKRDLNRFCVEHYDVNVFGKRCFGWIREKVLPKNVKDGRGQAALKLINAIKQIYHLDDLSVIYL